MRGPLQGGFVQKGKPSGSTRDQYIVKVWFHYTVPGTLRPIHNLRIRKLVCLTGTSSHVRVSCKGPGFALACIGCVTLEIPTWRLPALRALPGGWGEVLPPLPARARGADPSLSRLPPGSLAHSPQRMRPLFRPAKESRDRPVSDGALLTLKGHPSFCDSHRLPFFSLSRTSGKRPNQSPCWMRDTPQTTRWCLCWSDELASSKAYSLSLSLSLSLSISLSISLSLPLPLPFPSTKIVRL